ncbi:AAA ATPase [Trypanosoma theileri]|uniref:AAA ATPase n=1 Tax=Trypanosoma theileri TaxID=67003 RepID=A0A1X0NHS3_9TRYP|nr:AAA ATPase [Trypanosoma theileri]ORC84312.1 AAA ATPase [Trypanosoma theileri]
MVPHPKKRGRNPSISKNTPITTTTINTTNITNTTTTGEHNTTELTYFELFNPLLQRYLSLPVSATAESDPNAISETNQEVHGKQNSNNKRNGSKTDDRVNITVQEQEQESKGNMTPHHRYEILRDFTFPNSVSAYLHRVSLLPTLPVVTADQTTMDVLNHHDNNNNNNNNNNNGNNEDGEKRRRVEEHTDLDEKDVLAEIQREAEARLPPFANDSEFITAHEMRYVWRDWVTLTSGMFSGNGQMQRVITGARLDIYHQCRPCQAAALAQYTQHITIRLQKMRMSPRIVRVAQKFRLQQHELTALIYLLVCHCGSLWPLNYSGGGALTPAAVAYHNELNSFQLMHFLADYREHMKQGVVTTDVKNKSSFMDSKLAIPQETIAALSGDNLSEEQLIKLEKTALSEVLLAEREAIAAAAAAVLTKTSSSSLTSTTVIVTAGGEGGKVKGEEEDSINRVKHTHKTEDEEDSNSCSGSSGASTPKLESLGIDPAVLQSGDESAIENAVRERLQVIFPSNHEEERQNSTTNGTSGNLTGLTSHTQGSSNIYVPYVNDIEYMDESFKLLANVVRLRGAESDMKDDEEPLFSPKTKVEATIRELRGKVRVATAIHRARTAATLKEGKFIPRIEALSQKLNLSELEKRIMLLMVGNVVSHDMLVAINGRYVMRDGQRLLTVGYILFVLCDTLKERVAARSSFYRSSPLVANNILSLTLDGSGGGRTCFNTDLMDYVVDVDRKIVDHLMGTETETAEMVPGSRLYMPDVPILNVVLPKTTKELVLTTIQHYSMFEQCKSSCGFGEGLGVSTSGLVFLFYGPSGTGKTMLANAVAHELGKRILLVSMLQFKSDDKAPEMLRFIFREAKLNDAIIFFDECESIFESRERNPLVTSLLTEFEKYDGLIILATNKAQVIDEAMNRRISLMVEFRLPDQEMREKIWQAHLPRNLALHEDVSIPMLALNYELSGGLIRNATIAAINNAVAREKSTTPTLCMRDLEEGARLQLRGFFLAAEKPPGASTESYFTPKRSLSHLVVDRQTQQQLETLVRLAKGRSTLFSQWGFNEEDCADQGAMYLFHGPSGTGKSLAAEGIAYECASTIRLCNVAELLLVEELKVHHVFSEARKLGAIIVFDEAQALFNHSDQGRHTAKLIHYHAMRYPRPVIFIVTTGTEGSAGVDMRASPFVFQQQISFRMPTQQLRRELWRRAIPEKVPVADGGIDFDELSSTSVSAKLIRAAAFSACCRVALLGTAVRHLTTEILREELENLQLKERERQPHVQMFA